MSRLSRASNAILPIARTATLSSAALPSVTTAGPSTGTLAATLRNLRKFIRDLLELSNGLI